MCSTGQIKKTIEITLPYDYVVLLLKSDSLWDDKDRFVFEKYGKLPPKRKIVRNLVKKHLVIRGFIKE